MYIYVCLLNATLTSYFKRERVLTSRRTRPRARFLTYPLENQRVRVRVSGDFPLALTWKKETTYIHTCFMRFTCNTAYVQVFFTQGSSRKCLNIKNHVIRRIFLRASSSQTKLKVRADIFQQYR